MHYLSPDISQASLTLALSMKLLNSWSADDADWLQLTMKMNEDDDENEVNERVHE